MEGLGLVIMIILALLVLFPVAFIVCVNAGGCYQATKYLLGTRKVEKKEGAFQDLACSIDTDCPTGYICVNGRCVPSQS